MDTVNNIKIAFQVETKRIIEILSTEIYDSPLALLRENLQNAYDAVLMRNQDNTCDDFRPMIKLEIHDKIIQIIDNGIGMDLETLKNNFWKAGSSGKRDNEVAQRAGVIGTFGIGAMANFGVCESLEVITTSINGNFSYQSKAIRDNLKIGEDCIDTIESQFNNEIGTKIIATLDKSTNIDLQTCINYLKPYIEYLPIPVYINGIIYSQKLFAKQYEDNFKNAVSTFSKIDVSHGGFKYDFEGCVLANSFVYVKIDHLQFQNKTIEGNILLFQGATNVMCYRNYFGLSNISVSHGYNFGGYANLSFLTPAAGREALSRDSLSVLNSLFDSIEFQITYILSELEISNTNISFQKFIANKGLLDLGKHLTIRVNPENIEIALSTIPFHNPYKSKSFYVGNNPESIKIFASEKNDLYLPSPSNPRRQIQLHFLAKNKVRQQGDDIQINKIYNKNELTTAEGTILFKINNVITDDYLIKDVNVLYADISHGVTSKITKEGEILNILISKTSPSIIELIHFYDVDYSVLSGFVKDYVRRELYQKFSQYVPSATRGGADALYKILLRNRELFKIDVEEQGELDSLINDFLHNKTSLTEVTKKFSSVTSGHTQTFRANQVGTIEQAIPDLIHDEQTVEPKSLTNKDSIFEAMPPLLRIDQNTNNLKLLRTSSNVSQLNNFKLFISLSERLYSRDKDFFFEPHTTKIIWGNHKIIFIFGHISNKITLYYDIELKESINETPIGGSNFPTTTIITQDKIFIPIPEVLEEAFYLNKKSNSKEFYIRYDLITDID